MTPRILFSNKNLTRTDIDLLSLIISLTLNSNHCYAKNRYLANYINTSIRTISDSLSKLKRLGYIIIKYENNERRIYLNKEKIPTKVATDIEENCNNTLATNCYHNINNNRKNNKLIRNEPIPYWMEHPEVCKASPMTEDEIKALEKEINSIK